MGSHSESHSSSSANVNSYHRHRPQHTFTEVSHSGSVASSIEFLQRYNPFCTDEQSKKRKDGYPRGMEAKTGDSALEREQTLKGFFRSDDESCSNTSNENEEGKPSSVKDKKKRSKSLQLPSTSQPLFQENPAFSSSLPSPNASYDYGGRTFKTEAEEGRGKKSLKNEKQDIGWASSWRSGTRTSSVPTRLHSAASPPLLVNDALSALQRENEELRSKWRQSEEEKKQLEGALAAQKHSFRSYEEESKEEIERWKAKCKALAERLAAELFSPAARSTTRERSSSETIAGVTGSRVTMTLEKSVAGSANGAEGSSVEPTREDASAEVVDVAGWGKCREEVAFLIHSQEEERAFTIDILTSILEDLGMKVEEEDKEVARENEEHVDGVRRSVTRTVVSKSQICRLLARVSLGMQSQSAEWTRRLAFWCSRLQQQMEVVEELEETIKEGPLRVLFDQCITSNSARVHQNFHIADPNQTSPCDGATPPSRATERGMKSEKQHTGTEASVLSHLLDFSSQQFLPANQRFGGEQKSGMEREGGGVGIPQWRRNDSDASTVSNGRRPKLKWGRLFSSFSSSPHPQKEMERNDRSEEVASTPVGCRRASGSESTSSAPLPFSNGAPPQGTAIHNRTHFNCSSALPSGVAGTSQVAGGSSTSRNGVSSPRTLLTYPPSLTFKNPSLPNSPLSVVSEPVAGWCCDVLKACLRGIQFLKADLVSFHADLMHQPALLNSQSVNYGSSSAKRAFSPASTCMHTTQPHQPLFDRLSNELLTLKQRSFELQEKLLRRFSREEQIRQEVVTNQAQRLHRVTVENRRLMTFIAQLREGSTPSPHADPVHYGDADKDRAVHRVTDRWMVSHERAGEEEHPSGRKNGLSRDPLIHSESPVHSASCHSNGGKNGLETLAYNERANHLSPHPRHHRRECIRKQGVQVQQEPPTTPTEHRRREEGEEEGKPPSSTRTFPTTEAHGWMEKDLPTKGPKLAPPVANDTVRTRAGQEENEIEEQNGRDDQYRLNGSPLSAVLHRVEEQGGGGSEYAGVGYLSGTGTSESAPYPLSSSLPSQGESHHTNTVNPDHIKKRKSARMVPLISPRPPRSSR